MSIEGLLSIRGDASGAIAEMRKVSEGLGQIREKGQRAGSGIATAIGALSDGLMKFQFAVAGVSTAFEVLKAGAAAAKWAWDRWAISPAVKAEIKWLAEQRKEQIEFDKKYGGAAARGQRIAGNVTQAETGWAENAATTYVAGRNNRGLTKEEFYQDAIDAITGSHKAGEITALKKYGVDIWATGDPVKDRANIVKTLEAIADNTEGFANWTEKDYRNPNRLFDPANTRDDYEQAQLNDSIARRDAAIAKADAERAKTRGGAAAATDVAGKPILDWTIRPDVVKIVSPAKIEFSDYSQAGRLDDYNAKLDRDVDRRNAGRDWGSFAGKSIQDNATNKMDEWRAGLSNTANAYNAFSDALASGVDAAISGQESIGKAMMSAASQSLRAKAVQASVEALWETARGISEASMGLPSAAGHFAAAGKYAAVAALAGAGAAALGHAVGGMGGGGSGAGASAPAASSPRASASEQGINVVINIGHGFIGSEKDLGDTVSRAVDQARRNGRGKTTPQWD